MHENNHTECDPNHCPEKWYNDLGPGRGKPEKPLHEVVRGLLRFSAPQWMIDRLAGRAEKLHAEIEKMNGTIKAIRLARDTDWPTESQELDAIDAIIDECLRSSTG